MAEANGRERQRRRTRKALLEAAARLTAQGRTPTLEEVAEEALVSRATAYRYFPGVEPLLVEAALDVAAPGRDLFDGMASADPVERLRHADRALQDMVRANEPALRLMLVHSLQQAQAGESAVPARQNRRTPLIEAALAPATHQFEPASLERLVKALALVIGTESHIVLRDVLRLKDDEADSVRAWMIGALVDAARR